MTKVVLACGSIATCHKNSLHRVTDSWLWLNVCVRSWCFEIANINAVMPAGRLRVKQPLTSMDRSL